ncbi:MAG: succinate CoA transferase, partial [Bacillota bacterium]|nr:succinate CoA transferase [Bacillota bacterium]
GAIHLFTGASVGDELDGALARANAIDRRLPYQTQNDLRNQINQGQIRYMDMHLSHVADQLRYGYLGAVDVAIIEAAGITADGQVIPSTSVGNVPVFLEQAKRIMIEICTAQPEELEGMHDIYLPAMPPERKAIPLLTPSDRIGSPYYQVDPNRISAIVYSDVPDSVGDFKEPDQNSRLMADHLISFLEREVKQGRLPASLRPLQSGVGATANAVLAGLQASPFRGLSFYSEVIQDAVLSLIDTGTFAFASATSLTLSSNGRNRFYNNLSDYRDHILLRPQEISNHPELIRRLGIISMNTAIEVDLCGHVNSTHIMGNRMMNGIGGSGDFTRNASLSIFMTSSTAKNGAISAIVPFVSHCDHTEHDVHVVVTEQGVADLRGKCPRERAQELIHQCAHPDYREALSSYERKYLRNHHTGHDPKEALSWHERYLREGTMLQ